MADKVVQKSTLSLECEFGDGDTRTITVDNPKSTLTAAAIENVGELAKGVIIGDKAGAKFSRFKTAKVVRGTTTYLDLND